MSASGSVWGELVVNPGKKGKYVLKGRTAVTTGRGSRPDWGGGVGRQDGHLQGCK